MAPTSSKLGRKPAQRAMLLKNLATSLILFESIRTTRARAKAVIPIVERLIAKSKKQSLQVAIRSLKRHLTHENASRKVLEVLIQRYAKRSSGFCTLKAAGCRKGDGAELVDLSLIPSDK